MCTWSRPIFAFFIFSLSWVAPFRAILVDEDDDSNKSQRNEIIIYRSTLKPTKVKNFRCKINVRLFIFLRAGIKLMLISKASHQLAFAFLCGIKLRKKLVNKKEVWNANRWFGSLAFRITTQRIGDDALLLLSTVSCAKGNARTRGIMRADFVLNEIYSEMSKGNVGGSGWDASGARWREGREGKKSFINAL